MKIYYVEKKSYFKKENGIEYQIADGGELPILYTSKNKAIYRAEYIAKLLMDSFDYELVISNDQMPCKKEWCLYGVRIEDKKHSIRTEIRVYEVITNN